MKTLKKIYSKVYLFLGIILVTAMSCERGLSDEVEFATYPTTPEIFSDGFVGGLDYFPFAGSFAEAFSVGTEVTYSGSASMRFDIPVFGVGYGGATFPSTGPRDLSGYDALTFWAKASQGADINEIGFGINGDTNDQYKVTLQNLPITTQWRKYVIAIPDASKLTEEKGMFWYAEGAANAAEEGGYTFWIDELKFEKLGTIGQSRPSILNGLDETQQTVVGSEITITGTQTFNLGSGLNQTTSIAPSYFTFNSTDVDVARVSDRGVISVVGNGTATITAILGGVRAEGSLTLEVSTVATAPTPTEDPANVISLFSDAYTDLAGVSINGNYGGQTTQSALLNLAGDNVISYTDLNYVGFEFQNPTVDGTDFNFLHLDIFTNSTTTTAFNVEIRDRGSNGMIDTNVFTGAPSVDDARTVFSVAPGSITQGQWISIDIPLTGGLAAQKDNLAALIFTGDIDFLVDNIYFYK